jgi:hypothetical protein
MEISYFYHVTSDAWYAVRWTGAWVLSRTKRLVAADRHSAALSGRFWGGSFPGLKPRLRKAYVAANLYGDLDLGTRARRGVAKAAWAVLLDHFMVKARCVAPTSHLSPIRRAKCLLRTGLSLLTSH